MARVRDAMMDTKIELFFVSFYWSLNDGLICTAYLQIILFFFNAE